MLHSVMEMLCSNVHLKDEGKEKLRIIRVQNGDLEKEMR